jgi:glycosyltransferase involved in cell wall biosynthesis
VVVTPETGEKKGRIAVLLPSLNGGGAERVALFLVEVLAEAGYHVDLLVAVNAGAYVDHPVAKRHRVDLKAPNEMLSALRIARWCRREKPDLLIAFVHTAKIMAGIARKLVPDIPLVISVHAALDIPKPYRFWWRRWFGHGPERWLYRGVLGAHVVCGDLKGQVERHFAIPEERVEVIYNAMTTLAPPCDLPPEHEAWFDRPVLMTAGRMTRQKDQATLVEAFARSGLAGSARLLLLGTGELEGALRDQARRLGVEGDVVFAGFRADVASYLARASGFFLSSKFEGFALVLAEALATGVPVIAFDCPSGPREVLEGGKLGRLLPPGDIEGLAQAMRDAAAGRLVRPCSMAVGESLERFSPALIAQGYVSFVERCLQRRA